MIVFCDSNRDDEKWLDLEYILKLRLIRFVNR